MEVLGVKAFARDFRMHHSKLRAVPCVVKILSCCGCLKAFLEADPVAA